MVPPLRAPVEPSPWPDQSAHESHDPPDAPEPAPDARKKREEVDELSAPQGAVVYGAVHQEGLDELRRSTSALAWSGLAAGLSMGFSFAVEAFLRHGLPDTAWRPLISKLGYSVGFIIVVLGRQQLFTENTLTVILPLLRKRNAEIVVNVGRLWTAVLLSNLVGALIFATALGHTAAVPDELRATLTAIGQDAMKDPFTTVLVRGIFAGWLIALMVWLLPYAETSRVWVILILTYVIGLGSFAHVIAGSVETLFLVVTGARTVADFLAHFFVPALVGNVIGGVALVAALAHAQFVAASDEGEERVAVTD